MDFGTHGLGTFEASREMRTLSPAGETESMKASSSPQFGLLVRHEQMLTDETANGRCDGRTSWGLELAAIHPWSVASRGPNKVRLIGDRTSNRSENTYPVGWSVKCLASESS